MDREPLIPVQDGKGRWGFVRRGRTVIPFRYESAEPFSEGLALVRRPDRGAYLFVDEHGSNPFGVEFMYATSFHRGTATAKGLDDGLWGIIDREGEWVRPPTYLTNTPFTVQDVYRTSLPDSYGWLNADGELVDTVPASDEARRRFFNFWGLPTDDEGNVSNRFSEGLTTECFQLEGEVTFRDTRYRCGIQDRSGRWVVAPNLLVAPEAFRGGFAYTQYLCGASFLSRAGERVARPKFDVDAARFPADGLFPIQIEGAEVWVRRDGIELARVKIPCMAAVSQAGTANCGLPLLGKPGCSDEEVAEAKAWLDWWKRSGLY